uniref:Delta14-sterol reductase n=1 Tax=Rhizophora mucronata TaxID=61149 RepID=A0A2P2KME2_RHIMU
MTQKGILQERQQRAQMICLSFPQMKCAVCETGIAGDACNEYNVC